MIDLPKVMFECNFHKPNLGDTLYPKSGFCKLWLLRRAFVVGKPISNLSLVKSWMFHQKKL